MKFDIVDPRSKDPKPNRLAQLGDVYQMRGGRYGSGCWVVVSTDNRSVSVFGADRETGEIVSAAKYKRDYFNQHLPIGRADIPDKLRLWLF